MPQKQTEHFMNFYKSANLFLFLIFLSFELSAQDFFFNTEVINVEQGLPNRRTYGITQDLDGFIWISTPGKISRYDGNNFKNYTSDFLNTNESLPTFLAIDDTGLLWYCEYSSYSTTNETGIINTKTDEVQSIEKFSKGLIKQNTVSNISTSDATAAILIETKDGIIYSYEAGVFSVIFKFPKNLEKSPCALAEFEKGVYWYGKGSNLYKIEDEKIVEQIYVPDYIMDIKRFQETYIIKSIVGINKKLWKLENKKIVLFTDGKSSKSNIAHAQNTFNNYSFICSNQIIFKNKFNETIYQYDNINQITTSKDKSLKLQDVFIDQQNIHWITTENGLIKITIQKNNFKKIGAKNSIRGIHKIDETLWIGGYYENITSETEISKMIPKSSNISIVGFTKDTSNNLWMGTTSNLILKYNLETKAVEKIIHDSNTMLLPYYNKYLNKIFVGQENGISIYNPKTKQFSYQKSPISRDALEVRQFIEYGEDIWIISSKGLLVMNKRSGDIYEHFDKTDGFLFDNFNHLHIDELGVFWLGTRGNGLLRWDRAKNDMTVFTRENGLSNNNIYAVYEDEFNNLWLPTDYGLNQFNKKSLETRIFLSEDGIAHEEFNTFAHYRDEAGKLYFGGLEGITVFHPKDFLTTDFYPKLKLINLKKSAKDAAFSESILAEFLKNKKIHLSFKESNINLSLALLDYAEPKENKYAYKLKGFNNEWLYTESNNIALNNLPPGKYNLLLKAKSAFGNNAEEILSIPIFVEPPIYKRLWFLFLMVSLIGLFIYLGFRWRFKKLENDRLLLEKEVDKRTKTILEQTEELKALDKAKTQFFSNITHEFRTPLTLIIGPLEQLLNSNLAAKTQYKLKGIHKNANLLKDLINQLLDLSKIESGNIQIEITHGDIIDYSKDLIERFRGIAEQKNQSLIFKSNLEHWETEFDKGKWNKIVFNLLSNAIKFTPGNGKIELFIARSEIEEKEFITLKVIDNGIGIAREKQKNIFERFFQADASTTRIQDGTGIGLALVKELVALQKGTISLKSEVNKGSTFLISLPILKSNLVVRKLEQSTESKTELKSIVVNHQVKNQADVDEVSEKSNKLELLIIEDNAEIRSYIRSCIDESIYKITEAENGEIGIQNINELIPDLVISDIMMPKKDGYEVVETIRKQQSTSHIPIILLTAKSSLESRLKGLSRGADAYLTKPFSPEELRLRIQKLIELRQLFQNKVNQNIKTESKAESLIQLVTSDNTYDKEHVFIKELRQYIENNIDENNLSGETIALHFSMSRMQLHRKLKALTNMSISLFLRRVRLKKAIELMQTQQMNISEIAYDVGFLSPAQFSKTFKKEMGKTPSQFLEELKKEY